MVKKLSPTKVKNPSYGICLGRLYQETDIKSESSNPCGGLFASCLWVLFIKRKKLFMKKILLFVFALSIILPTLAFASFDTSLKYGSSGSAVTKLQNFLQTQGLYSGKIDGSFGPGTVNAVKAFQSANGLQADGYFGLASRTKANSVLATNTNAPSTVAGCTSTVGYSPTTGVSCSGTTSAYIPPTSNASLYSANTLFANLSPQLAYITCDWYNRYGAVLFSQDSNGLLIGPVNSNTASVEADVGGVINTSYTGSVLAPGSCNIQFPAGASIYAGGLSTFTVGLDSSGNSPVNVENPNVDFAQIKITAPNTYVADYARKVNYCSTRASVGDSVAISGWPPGETNQIITGSVTGTSGYYDITNITVPDGMLGSVAVSLTNGCVIGQVNSLGQIADIQGLSYTIGF